MFRKIILIVLFTSVLLVSVCLTDNKDISVIAESNYESYQSKTKKDIEIKISKKSIKIDQETTVTITLNVDLTIDGVSFVDEGFIVNEIKEKSDNEIEFRVSYNRSMDDYTLSILIELEDGTSISKTIYGFEKNGKVFISELSSDSAKMDSFKEDLDIGLITEIEYDELIQENANNCIKNLDVSTNITTGAFGVEEILMAPLSSGDTHVNGTLSWEDDNGTSHPLQYIIVEIWDKDSVFHDKLGETTTDSNGYYSFDFDNITFLENGGVDLFIIIRTEFEDVMIAYSYQSIYSASTIEEVANNVSTGSTTNISFDVDMSNDTGRAFQVFQALIYGSKYVDEMGDDPSSVTVIFPGGSSYYLLGTISLLEGDYMDWDVILHEYGHHLQREFDLSNSPGGDHNSTSNLSVLRGSKDKGIRLAWGESWPTVYAIQVTKYFQSYLLNIDNISDEIYQDTTDQTVTYSLEIAGDDGESQEKAIMGVLYDMYDSGTNESFDSLDFSDQSMWNFVNNCEPESFSDFANYIYDSQSFTTINKFSSLTEEYGMSPNNLSIGGSIGVNPSTFSWNEGGSDTSTLYENDEFDLIFLNESNIEYYRIENVTSPYTPSISEWDAVLNQYGDYFSVRVSGKETNSPVTGEYYTPVLTFSKSTIETITDTINFTDRTRYHEEIFTLYPRQDIEFTVSFETSGKKIIQTFGSFNTYMYIYDMSGNLLASDYYDGYSLNSFITFTSSANTDYIIKVKFASTNQNGEIKLGIYPTIYSGINDFEDIYNTTMPTGLSYVSSLPFNTSIAFSLNITETRSYIIETQEYNNPVDTFLYIIDVTTSDVKLYNDDGGDWLYSKITTELEAGHTYLIIVAAYNITNQSGDYELTVTKN